MKEFRHTIKIKGGTYPVGSVRLYENGKYKVGGLILDREDVCEETLEKIGVIKTYKWKR